MPMNRIRKHENTQGALILKPGREESVKRHHPWIFSGSVSAVKGTPGSGGTIDVLAADGTWLAAGAYSPHSQIRARLWSFTPGEKVDTDFFRSRLECAVRSRESLLAGDERNACRLVYAESDGLPGLVVDRYHDFLVCQFLSAGAEYWKDTIVQHLADLTAPEGIFERSDTDSRAKEGIEMKSGTLWGRNPPGLVEIREQGLRFLVDIEHGHKTGFYLDQRENRAQVARFSNGAKVLNCFSYTGGFSLWAIKGGATEVTNVETSADAIEIGLRNARLNNMDRQFLTIGDDVFKVLRGFRDTNRSFDLIILDPPKFAASAGQVERAARGYKDINLLAMKLLKPGGILFTFSCSGHILPALFQKIVADAALDARRDAQIIRFLGQADDHPVALAFPESHYLKGFIVRVS
jgi:23S rRNA (cytosine1962-C5)-methyltransferase